MIAVEFAKYISQELSDLAYGDNVYIDDMPKEPDRAVMVASDGGPEPDFWLDYRSPDLHIVVRSDSNANWGKEKAEKIHRLLRRKSGFKLGDYLIITCIAVQSEPIALGKDDRGRYKYSLNFELHLKEA